MKLTRSILALFLLLCCTFWVLTSPPQRAHAEESGNACDQCTTDKNNCMSGCGSNNYQCMQNCNNNYGFCIAAHNCKPLDAALVERAE
jgi:hypothetical protein